MFSPEVHQMIFEEKYKDLQRELDHHQLVKTALLRRSDNRESYRRMAGWIGSRMVAWGSKLQRYNQSQRQTTIIQRGL